MGKQDQEPHTQFVDLVEPVFEADVKRNVKMRSEALVKLYSAEYYIGNKERLNKLNKEAHQRKVEKNEDSPEYLERMRQHMRARMEKIKSSPELQEKHTI